MHLLLVAHGSPVAQHAVTMREVRDAVRDRGFTCEVAFLDHDEPLLTEVVGALPRGAHVVAVPMLLNHAYHARVDIPSAIEAASKARPDVELRATPPLGPDPLLIEAMERRLAEVLSDDRAGELGVVMVASGTSDDAARSAVAGIASDWAARRGSVVRHAFVAGGGPGVDEAVAAVRSALRPDASVALVPYLFETGVLLERAKGIAAAEGVDLVAAPLRSAPEVVDLVLVRAGAVQP